MTTINKRAHVLAGAANLLAAIFLWAALSKIADLAGFRLAIERSGLVPAWGLAVVAVLIPATELVLAFSLFGLRPTRAALTTAAALLVLFLGFQIYTATQIGWFGSVAGGCPCFAGATLGRPLAQIYIVMRNTLFVGLAGGALWMHAAECGRAVNPALRAS